MSHLITTVDVSEFASFYGGLNKLHGVHMWMHTDACGCVALYMNPGQGGNGYYTIPILHLLYAC
jgi:hypothetical protein